MRTNFELEARLRRYAVAFEQAAPNTPDLHRQIMERVARGPVQRRAPWRQQLAMAAALLLFLAGVAWGIARLRNQQQLLPATTASPTVAGSWSAAGSMATGRAGHTATGLPNGKVLVVGGIPGNKGSAPLATAELYDPSTNRWTSAGTMTEGRLGASATLLENGKVLVAGGRSSSGPLASAELFDPAGGRWAPAGKMSVERTNHTATLLPSGRVLVVGGQNPPGFFAGFDQASAELYDPVANRWSPVASMPRGHYAHTATLLRNGKVLIVGGSGPDVNPGYWNGITQVELYDPAANRWAPAASLTVARSGHTATLLPSGKVLVVNGNPTSAGASAVLYDPDQNAWRPAAAPAGRDAFTATLLPNGTVLVVGGGTPAPGPAPLLAAAEFYDPVSDRWVSAGRMAEARWSHTATLMDETGKVLISGGAGGVRGGNAIASAEVYDPAKAGAH